LYSFFTGAMRPQTTAYQMSKLGSRGVRLSPRPISTGQLSTLLRLHTRPINLVFYKGSYQVNPVGDLILGSASRLDAFSAYPIHT
jgi:hypothetical protein